jgi:Protein of unknown function (DUF3551)
MSANSSPGDGGGKGRKVKQKFHFDADQFIDPPRFYCWACQQPQIRRRQMKSILFVLSLVAATTVLSTSTQAQNYPWCADYGSMGGTNCGFTTLAQCEATVTGMRGFCEVNTQYQPVPGAYPPPRYRPGYPQ